MNTLSNLLRDLKRKRFLSLLILVLLIVGVITAVVLVQRQIELRGRAAELPFTNHPRDYFPYGMFNDANPLNGTNIAGLVTEWKSKGLDSLFTTNGYIDRIDPMLTVTDTIPDFKIFTAPQAELNPNWFDATSVQPTIENARNVIYPLVDLMKDHPSLFGYAIMDDAPEEDDEKIALAIQAFNERDPNRPVMPTYVDATFHPSQGVYTMYNHPVKIVQNYCDFNADNYNWPKNIYMLLDERNRLTEQDIPIWNMAVQAYGDEVPPNPGYPNGTHLREPNVEEIRLQNWLTLAEGVKGIFWMHYHLDGYWRGLRDNPPLYAEVEDLAGRVNPLRPTLLGLKRDYNEKLTVTAQNGSLGAAHKPYISTLVEKEGNKYYTVAVNRSCSPQTLTINSNAFSSGAKLKDLETQEEIDFGTPINFRAADGKVYEVVGGSMTAPSPTPAPNIIQNGNFEGSGGFALRSNTSIDSTVAHSGSRSYKIDGPGTVSYGFQNLTLKPDTMYSLSFWVKTENVTGDGVRIRLPQLVPSAGQTQATPRTNGTTDWTQVVYTFLTRTNYQSGRIDIEWSMNPGDVAWIDDVILCEGPLGCNGTFSLPPLPDDQIPTPTPSTPSPTPQGPTPTPGSTSGGIPSTTPGYGQDVEAWWATHPMNKASSNYIPVGAIESPSPQVNVKQQFNGNIQAAIASLPQSGGTLYFEPGEYDHNFKIVGRGNIHFVSDGSAVIKGGITTDGRFTHGYWYDNVNHIGTLTSCEIALDYDFFINAIFQSNNPNHQQALDCIENRKGNVYFKNIVFDGNDEAVTAFRIAAYRDVLFDNVTFQNFHDPLTTGSHTGNINGHQVIDNIWIRKGTFLGDQRFAVYLDGCHNCGVLDSSTTWGYGAGGILFLTNDDYTYDYDESGTKEIDEQRIGSYLVVEGNTFGNRFIGVSATAANLLLKGNVTITPVVGLLHTAIRHSNRGVVYEFFGNKILNNYIQDGISRATDGSVTFVGLGGNCSNLQSGQTCAIYGKHTVKDNKIQTTNAITTLVRESGTPVQPVVIQNNCVNGTFYGTSTSCTMTTPTPTGIGPTPTPGGPPTSTPQPTTPGPFTWNGTVFVDNNQNGVKDTGEPGYQNATLTATNTTTGSSLGTRTTSASGFYSFTNLLTAGQTYQVTLTVPSGYSPTTSPTLSRVANANISESFGIVQGTANTPTPTSSQTVIGDINGDGNVDIIDFNIWRDEYLGNVTTTTADLNGDSVVDLVDFNIWLGAFRS